MTMATWCGIELIRRSNKLERRGATPRREGPLGGQRSHAMTSVGATYLNGHDLVLFAGDELVDFGDVAIGQFLDLRFGPFLLVFGSQLVLYQLFHGIVGIAAQVAHGDL